MPLPFFQNLVGAVLMFVFDIKDGINEVLLFERTHAILPAKACENRAVAKSSLSVEIQLGGPPSRSPVFELRPEGVKVVPAALGTIRREILDFEVSRLFQIVVVRNEVGALLSLGD